MGKGKDFGHGSFAHRELVPIAICFDSIGRAEIICVKE